MLILEKFAERISRRLSLFLSPNPGGTGISGGVDSSGSGSTGSGSGSPATPPPAAGAGGGFSSMDIPVYGLGAGLVAQGPPCVVRPGWVVDVAPNPANAAPMYISEYGPAAVLSATGPRRQIPAAANPITISVDNLARVMVQGNVGDYLILTLRQK